MTTTATAPTRCDAADAYGICGPATFTEVAAASYLVTRKACAAHVNITRGWHATITGVVTRNYPVQCETVPERTASLLDR